MNKTAFLTITAALACASTNAWASGLGTARFGGEHGTPMDTNPTALFYNPGAIGASKGLDIYADGNFAWRVASYERATQAGCEPGADPDACKAQSPNEVPEPADAIGANNGEASLFNFAAAPFLGGTLRIPIGDDFGIAFGAGFFVPFGGTSSWSTNEAFDGSAKYPGAVDGVQRWWAIDGYLRALYVSGAVAFSMFDFVHIGISGGIALSQVDTIRARVLGTNNNDLAQEGRAWLQASGVNGQVGGGVLLTPLDGKLRIGASYQAPAGITEAVMNGYLKKVDGSTGQVSGADQIVEFHTVWPDTFRLGVALNIIDALELRLHGEVQRWSLLDDQCIAIEGTPCEIDEAGKDVNGNVAANIPRRWQDGFAVRAGASYWFLPEVEGMVGVGYDSSAIPDEVLDPSILDFHDISVALAARFQIVEVFAAQIGYTQFFYVPRDTTGKFEHLQSPSNNPSSAGKYSQAIGVINVGAEVTFDVFGEDDE
jgi:long-chain fatty acid transport protein